MESQKKRIVIFMPGKGPIQSHVLDGVASYFSQKGYADLVDILEVCPKSYSHSKLLEWMEQLTVEDCDLVITSGAATTRIALDVFNKKKIAPPVVFCSVLEQFREEMTPSLNASESFMTGVFAVAQPNIMPIQMILRLAPNAQNFLLPYRKEAKFGRMEYEAQRIKQYCKARKLNVTPVQIDSLESIDQLRKLVYSSDAIVVPESGLTPSDVQLFEQLCREEKKAFLGDSQAALKSGGLYGFKQDFQYQGAKVAEFAIDILFNGKKPGEIEPAVVRPSRQLHVNPDNMAESGVFLADDVIASFDQAIEPKDIPTYKVGSSMHTETALFYSLAIAFGQRVQQDSSACYLFRRYVGWPDNDEFNQEQAKMLVSREHEHHIFYDDRQAWHAWQQAQANGTTLAPMVIISISDQMVDDGAWHKKAREQGVIIAHIQLPAPDPLLPLHLLQLTKKKLLTLSLVIKADLDAIPTWLQSRINKLQAACNALNITLNIFGGTSYAQTHQAAQDATQSTDAVIFWPDAMCAHAASHLAQLCHDNNIALCAGGLLFGQIAPLCYGPDLLALREHLFKFTHELLHKKIERNSDITFTEYDIYRLCINEKLCAQTGIDLPEVIKYFSRYSSTPVHYERNIAACMSAIPRTEQDNVRLQAARKSFEDHMQEMIEREKRLGI